jgi:adenylate cyclase class 2
VASRQAPAPGRPDIIEAELKARVTDPQALRARLEQLAAGEVSTYRDTYYDTPGKDLTADGRELRVRVIEVGRTRRALLTYKEPPVDAVSQSKPEYETAVDSAEVTDIILRALGMTPLIAFSKHCVNYQITALGRNVLATIVTVLEIDGTFIELETMADEMDLAAALADVRAVLANLGISDDALTTEQYTDAVMRART